LRTLNGVGTKARSLIHTVPQVEGPSIALAVALASDHAALSVIVQTADDMSETVPPHLATRIQLQKRPSERQPMEDASVYVVHLASPSLTQPERSTLLDAVAHNLAIHMPILRHNPLARVVLLARVLPEVAAPPKANNNNATNESNTLMPPQCLALYRNLVLHQLTQGRDHERADVLECVRRTSDGQGFLVVTNEIYGSNSAGMMAFEIQYLASSIGHLGFPSSSAPNGGETSQVES